MLGDELHLQPAAPFAGNLAQRRINTVRAGAGHQANHQVRAFVLQIDEVFEHEPLDSRPRCRSLFRLLSRVTFAPHFQLVASSTLSFSTFPSKAISSRV